jgi:hypothetical protein
MDIRVRSMVSPRNERIVVAPVGGGWCMSCTCEEPLMFLSGGRAEAEARRLAQCLARLGLWCDVEVHDRRDRLVGRTVYRPQVIERARKTPDLDASAAVH